MGDTPHNIAVIGSGASGMAAALRCAELGASVTLISGQMPARCGSAVTRDGISAAVDTACGDSPEIHADDTLRCADFLADSGPVAAMCRAAPGIADVLARMGMVFERTAEGRPQLARSMGSSRARTLQSGRSTGQRLAAVLSGQIARLQAAGRVSPFFGWEFLSLVTDDAGCARGVVAQNLRSMEIKAFAADAVIICTGGFPALFGVHNSRSSNDGSAIAACWEQGACIANPEFVQVTPFAVSHGPRSRPLPDSIASLGGSLRVERDGRPCRIEASAPRDIASRAVLKAVRDAAPAGGAGAFLDLKGLDEEFLRSRMGPLMDICDGAGLDPLGMPLALSFAVCETLGGLMVGPDHASSVKGLFAAGGAACRYHGASALGGNELLASLYGGMAAADSAVGLARSGGGRSLETPVSLLAHSVEREQDAVARISAKDGPENVHAVALDLGGVFPAEHLIEKDNETLARALGKLEELGERLKNARLADRSEWANQELILHRRLARRLSLAKLFARASIARDESRGAHYKPAFHERNDQRWAVITRAELKGGEILLDHSGRVDCEQGERNY